MKRVPKNKQPPAVGKLLRVLVAGGMALAGAAAPVAVRADDKATSDKADQAATEKSGAKAADKAAAEKPAPGKGADKKESPKKAPAGGDDAGGVKGW